jgi:phosphatidylglycerophosphate synthase
MGRQAETSGKVAVILAPDDQGLVEVFDVPAVRRLALLARQIDLEVHVVGQVTAIRPVLSGLVPAERFHPVDHPESLNQAVERLPMYNRQQILVLKANYVVDQGSLARLMDVWDLAGSYFMETKEHTGEGLYLVPYPSLVPILRRLWSSSLPLAMPGEIHSVEGTDGLPYVLEGREAARVAEERLMRAQAAQTEKNDGFLARHLSRRISRPISERLAHTSATPNQVTMGGVVIGMTGAAFFSRPGYWSHVIGSLFFLFCIIVDGVDGEIARLKLQETLFGQRLDVITDNLVHVAIFTGIALGLYHDSGNPAYFWILLVLIGGFGLCGIAVYQCMSRRSPEELRSSGSTLRIIDMMNNRDFAYLLVALALVQRLQWFLVGAAIGTYLFALVLWTANHLEKRARR